jgi:hypothetical protein
MNPSSNVVALFQDEKPQRIDQTGALPDCPCLGIIDLYHEILPEAARVLILNDVRRKGLKARWRELAGLRGYKTRADGLTEWRKLFEYCRESAFLMGKAKPSYGHAGNFELSIDFLIRPQRFTDLIEGKYHR